MRSGLARPCAQCIHVHAAPPTPPPPRPPSRPPMQDCHYLGSIAVKNGKVFALFVRSPTKSFKDNEEKLRHIINTFTLL